MSISIASLKEAVQIKESIASLESRLEKILGAGASSLAQIQSIPLVKKGRKTMSAAARALIAAAQKARWAKIKGTVVAAEKAVVKAIKKSRKTMSPAARAKIAAAQRARWAKVKGTATAAKPAVVPAPKQAKGKMSAATKAKLSAKLKAVWAKRRAAIK